MQCSGIAPRNGRLELRMCGISGEVTFDGSAASVEAVAAMAATLEPRGPDGQGLVAHGGVALGHRRLKIIDLSTRSRQPMSDSELGLDIVFNGCIYNYAELRRELAGMGYRFFSDGDTEVVLKAWHAFGERAPERLQGMFAFAIVERESGRLALVRDRFGIKPLYLAEDPGRRLRFASTLPALVAAGGIDTSIDPVALHHYMSFHAVVPAPLTILNGVRKLPPATVSVFEPDGTRRDTVYWAMVAERDAGDEARDDAGWADAVMDATRRAVDRRMVADVPVGVLLSGGVDSSLIVALLAEQGQRDLMTFSIGFEAAQGEEGDEFRYSDRVAERFATAHHRIFVTAEGIVDAIPGTLAAMSEPMVSYDNVAFRLLSREVSSHVKVVQCGQGADEIFAGYHWYPGLSGSNDPVRDYAAAFLDRDHEEYARAVTEDLVGEDHSRELIARHFALPGADDPVDKALRLDSTVMLVDDPVKRVDNMTMASGLEARVPFLDHELVELAARIPPRHKLRDGGKGVLKDVARRVLPAEIIDRPKGYFPVPALKFLDGPVLEMVRSALGSARARARGIFRDDYVHMLLDDPKAHITPLRGSKLWQIASLELWLQAHEL